MKTDRERLIELFTDFGVGFEIREADNGIRCMYGNDKIEGYTFFFTIFEFDADGKFVSMGAYE